MRVDGRIDRGNRRRVDLAFGITWQTLRHRDVDGRHHANGQEQQNYEFFHGKHLSLTVDTRLLYSIDGGMC